MNEHASRLAALMANQHAVELALDAVTVLPMPGLLAAISAEDHSEVGRLITEAVKRELSADVDEAMEAEQERARAMDEAEHAGELPFDLAAEFRALAYVQAPNFPRVETGD